MSTLTAFEKRKLETILHMGGGYVLDFTDRTFQEFILDVSGRDIFEERYAYASGSKANRLRAFWRVEPDHVVANLLEALLKYGQESFTDSALTAECKAIVVRLKLSPPVEDLAALQPNADGRDYEVLAKAVREAIEKDEPEAALDRLHTFVVKYLRVLCDRRGIATDRDKPLHSLFGEYLKSLRAAGLVQSEMAERILKSSLSILEAFNTVRNERSLAHDNPLLAREESLLIFNSIASTIRFIRAIEERSQRDADAATADDDLPF